MRVVAGILRGTGGKFLIADRARSRSLQDYWEFPGGKLKPGESAEAALRRELAEELGIDLARAEHLQRIDHDYPDYRVRVDFYVVAEWQGTPAGLEGQQLRWVSPHELDNCRLLPADAPLIASLKRL